MMRWFPDAGAVGLVYSTETPSRFVILLIEQAPGLI